jgi:hypothetical protein
VLKVPSGRALVWGGAVLGLAGVGLVIVGVPKPWGGVIGATLSAAPMVMIYLGLAVHVAGLFKRASEAERRLARRNFSWCVRCHYPFDERAVGSAMLTCTECGVVFRAGEARAWNRIHPERVGKPEV